ncbi:hypothetical protein ACP70R_028230 [Stipagrostis hirtigluma subsp. patula]
MGWVGDGSGCWGGGGGWVVGGRRREEAEAVDGKQAEAGDRIFVYRAGNSVGWNESDLDSNQCYVEKMEDSTEGRRGWEDTSLGATDGIFGQAANLAKLGESVKWHVETTMMKIDFGKGQSKSKALQGKKLPESLLKECDHGTH